MLKKSMFLNPNVDLEGQEKGQQEAPQVPDELCRSCPSCKKLCFLSDLEANCFVCLLYTSFLRYQCAARLSRFGQLPVCETNCLFSAVYERPGGL